MARLLDEFVERPDAGGRSPRQRIAVLLVTCVGAAALLPWIAYLAVSLPRSHSVRTWNVAWVGFDVALAGLFGLTGWWVLQRRQVAILGLVVTATLLFCDAWFDVCFGWNSPQQSWTLVSAALFELPIAILLAASALRILQRSSAVVAQLRGQSDPPGSIWTQRFVMIPMDIDVSHRHRK